MVRSAVETWERMVEYKKILKEGEVDKWLAVRIPETGKTTCCGEVRVGLEDEVAQDST